MKKVTISGMKIPTFLRQSYQKNKSREEVKDTYYIKMQPKRKSSLEDEKNTSDLFHLPPPVVKVIQITEDVFSSQFVTRYCTIILKFWEWTILYFLSYHNKSKLSKLEL